jgi:hypothetical protein
MRKIFEKLDKIKGICRVAINPEYTLQLIDLLKWTSEKRIMLHFDNLLKKNFFYIIYKQNKMIDVFDIHGNQVKNVLNYKVYCNKWEKNKKRKIKIEDLI